MSLTNTQYNALMREYEARQIQNQHIVEKRREEVLSRIPQLKEIEDTISSLSVSKARLILDGQMEELENLKNEIARLRLQKDALLIRGGYPADYFTPPYLCKDCKDTGYIGNEKCHCFKQASIDLVYTQSNMKRILEQENFDSFTYEYYDQNQVDPSTGRSSLDYAKTAVTECRHFIEYFDKEFGNLLFYGDTGVGKTFLSNCVAKELLDRGHSVIYFTSFELFRIFERAAFKKDEEVSLDYQNLFDCDLLIIDDLGTEFSNTFTSTQLFLCLNERILRRKSTIISTNLGINQLAERYSERVFSRITSHYSLLKMSGYDIRIYKKLNGN